ncbi:MAG TPA: glycosyltransferase family 4 protein [Methylomirabilota bacterium]|nr:glycosyltransferase family 4 protein [Methylomirabilota bacterium]
MKVSVLAFDLSDNATGRADLLARLLAPRYEVEVVGPRFGEAVWRPARDGAVRYRALPGARWPRLATRLPALARLADGDVLLASKPRPTSFGTALLARRQRRRPLILDIDDWELGFFYRAGFWGRVGRLLNVSNPNGLPWTWLAERFVSRADALTVASRFLGERFGGVLVPHVRDTEAWAPERFDRAAARQRLGVGDARVVMFLGTPRAHKGVDDLVEATAGLDGARLVLVGADPAGAAARRWAARGHVKVVGEIPFDDVPRYLVAADVVAVPQRATSDTLGQVPAKLFDAMALGRPIVSTAVSMIPEILEGCGVLVRPGDPTALRVALASLLAEPATAAELGRRARLRCTERYSFTSARALLYPLIDELAAKFGARS